MAEPPRLPASDTTCGTEPSTAVQPSGWLTTGAWLPVPARVRANVSLAEAPSTSVAVTCRTRPAFCQEGGGLPLKVRVAASKLSHVDASTGVPPVSKVAAL